MLRSKLRVEVKVDSLQATAVWLSKEVPAAKQYKSAELVSQLSLALHDFILLRTGDSRYWADPLLGAPDTWERGAVLEYCSQELGLIQLHSGRTVLFHLNQVWTPGTQTEESQLYKAWGNVL